MCDSPMETVFIKRWVPQGEVGWGIGLDTGHKGVSGF